MNIYKIANIYWTESTSDLEEKFEALQELEDIWTTFYTDANSSQSFLEVFLGETITRKRRALSTLLSMKMIDEDEHKVLMENDIESIEFSV